MLHDSHFNDLESNIDFEYTFTLSSLYQPGVSEFTGDLAGLVVAVIANKLYSDCNTTQACT